MMNISSHFFPYSPRKSEIGHNNRKTSKETKKEKEKWKRKMEKKEKMNGMVSLNPMTCARTALDISLVYSFHSLAQTSVYNNRLTNA